MERHSIRLGSIAGIDLRVHVTWLAVFALVTSTLAVGYYPAVVPSAPAAEVWGLAALSALLLFASVLLHELAHSLVARREGLTVHSVTLFLFGGVSDLAAEPRTPGAELRVAAVGPASSLAIALATTLVAIAVSAGPALDALLGYVAIVNLLLGAFNLLPGFPLDGGRILHAVAWRLTRRPETAMWIAGGAGRVAGVVLFAVGAYLAVTGEVLDGVWLAAIGWFLHGAASEALARTRARARLGALTVADAMAREPAPARADESVDAVLLRLADRRRVALAATDGEQLGIVTVPDLRSVPRERRPWTPIRSFIRQPPPNVAVSPEQPLVAALDALDLASADAAPIVEDGRIVGLLLRDDIARIAELAGRSELPRAA